MRWGWTANIRSVYTRRRRVGLHMECFSRRHMDGQSATLQSWHNLEPNLNKPHNPENSINTNVLTVILATRRNVLTVVRRMNAPVVRPATRMNALTVVRPATRSAHIERRHDLVRFYIHQLDMRLHRKKGLTARNASRMVPRQLWSCCPITWLSPNKNMAGSENNLRGN